jgi:hypothetical protein
MDRWECRGVDIQIISRIFAGLVIREEFGK